MALTKISTGMLKADAASVDLNIDAGTLFLDVANNRIGIANTSPADALHIGGAGHLLFERGGELRSKDTSGNVKTIARVDGYNRLQYGWSGSGGVLFMGGGSYTERMRIHTNGAIGIGTSTPAQTLDVNGNIGINGSSVIDSNRRHIADDGSASSPYFTFAADVNTGMYRVGADHLGFATGGALRWSIDSSGGITQTGGSNYDYSGGGNFAIRHLTASQNITFSTKNSSNTLAEKMRIQHDGKVGIGTASPSAPLTVQSQSNAVGITLLGRTSDSIGELNFAASNGTNQSSIQSRTTDLRIKTLQSIPLTFHTANTEHMRIDSSGNVGIAKTNPGTKLDVAGDIRALEAIYSEGSAPRVQLQDTDGTNQFSFFQQSSSQLSLRLRNDSADGSFRIAGYGGTTTTDRMIIGSTGDFSFYQDDGTTRMVHMDASSGRSMVGSIGTNVAIGRFHIVGNSDVNDEDCQLVITDVDGSSGSRIPSIRFTGYHNGSFLDQGRIRGTDTQGVVISGSSAFGNDLVVQSTGVGVGTNSPTSKVDIRGAHGATHSRGQLYLSNTESHAINQGSQISLGGTYAGTADTYFGSIAARKENATSGNYAGYLQFGTRGSGTSNAERMRITSTGNVGIGTTAPTKTLHVDGVIGSQNSSQGTGFLELQGYGNTAFINHSGSSNLYFRMGSGYNTRMTLSSGGNLGIGTTSPGTKLDITTVANTAGIRVTAPNTTSQSFGATIAAGTNSSDYAFNINSAAGTGILRVRGDGKVGINETSPDYTLHVNSGTTNVAAKFESTDSTSTIQFVDPNGNCEFGTTGSIGRISPAGSYAVLEASQGAVVINNAAQDCDFRVESQGNAHMLHVNAALNSVGMGGAGISGVVLETVSATTGGAPVFRAGTADFLGVQVGTQGVGFSVETNNYFALWHQPYADRGTQTNLTERVRMLSSGRIGLGHTAPNANLHINAGNNTAVTIGDATNPAFQIGGTTNYRFGVYTDGETAYIENKNGDDGLAFRVKTAGEAMRVDGLTGNVGIGTSNPTTHLSVTNSGFSNTSTTGIPAIRTEGNYGGAIGLLDTKEAGWYAQDNGDTLYQYVGRASGTAPNASIVMTYKSSGNVGIGETLPTEKLHVGGNIKMQATTAIVTYQNAANTWNVGLDAADASFKFKDGTDERIRIDSSGRVSIGTTSNSNSALTVQGDGTTNTTFAFRADNSNGNHILEARDDGVVLVDTNYLYVNNNGGFYSNGAIRARGGITNDGGNTLSISSGSANINFNNKNFTNVGTISSGAISATGNIDLGTATDGSRRFRWYNDNFHALYYDNDLLGSQSADVITYYQNFVFRHQDSSNKVTIDSSGTITTVANVYATSASGSQAAYNLGWQNSARALEMRYDSSYYMGIEMHAQTRDLIFNNKSGDNAGDIRFFTGSTLTEKLTILANGNVGIGEGGSPDRKLHVGGSIKVGDDNAYEDTGDNFNGGVVFQTPIYTEYQWKWNGADDHETNLYCGSYFMAEIIFTQHQTNGGSDINRHFVGKWANNHTTHVLETVHDSGSTWSMTTSMTATDHNLNTGGSSSANGRLRIVETYGSGSFSFSTLTVRVYQGSLSNVTHTYG